MWVNGNPDFAIDILCRWAQLQIPLRNNYTAYVTSAQIISVTTFTLVDHNLKPTCKSN